MNLGTFLKLPIKNFNENFPNIIDINDNNNEIRINDSGVGVGGDGKIDGSDLGRKNIFSEN